ncbi:MAG: hypothetical protein ACFE7E_00655 [Candidatus Hodarchaeota archaeon]
MSVTDQNFLETKQPVTCEMCGEKFNIKIEREYLNDVKRFPFSYTFVHGAPPHAVVVYLDKDLNVRGTETSDLTSIKSGELHTPAVDVTPDTRPVLSARDIGKLEMDGDTVFILREIDGVATVKEIAEKTKMDLEKVCQKVQYLVDCGVLMPLLPVDLCDVDYHRIYELVPPYNPNNVTMTAGAQRSSATCTILSNLDKDYTVLEIARGLEKAGFDKSPREVLDTLEYFRARDVVRVKGLTKTDIPEEWNDPKFNQVPRFADGIEEESILKKVPIPDKTHYFIIKNIGKRSILDTTLGLIGLGIETNPRKVLEIIRKYQKQGLVYATF